MQLGMIGLGRLGAFMAQRLLRGGHEIVGYARHAVGEADFADRLMSAMRFEFGGHLEKAESMGGNAS